MAGPSTPGRFFGAAGPRTALTQARRNRGHGWVLSLLILSLGHPLVAYGEGWREAEQAAYDKRDLSGVASQLNLALASEGKSAEWLWRRARLAFETARLYPRQDPRSTQQLQEGMRLAEQAIKQDDRSAWAHAWYAFILGYSIEKAAPETQIRQAFVLAEHLKRAIALDPTLGSAYLALGRWHYGLADLSWVERKVASALFATPPEGSFAEAERLLKEGAKLEPWKLEQHLWLAKAQLKLGKSSQAKATLERALAVQGKESETGTRSHIQQLLKSL